MLLQEINYSIVLHKEFLKGSLDIMDAFLSINKKYCLFKAAVKSK